MKSCLLSLSISNIAVESYVYGPLLLQRDHENKENPGVLIQTSRYVCEFVKFRNNSTSKGSWVHVDSIIVAQKTRHISNHPT